MEGVLKLQKVQIIKKMRYHLTPVRTAIIRKTKNNQHWWGYGKKGNFMHCWWECKLVQPLWKTIWRYFTNLKIELPYNSVFLLLGIYTKKIKTLIQIDVCTSVFIAALFIKVKIWKQPKCLSTEEWINVLVYIYNRILLIYYKKIEILSSTTGMDLQGITFSEISQISQRKTMYDLTYMWNLRNEKI